MLIGQKNSTPNTAFVTWSIVTFYGTTSQKSPLKTKTLNPKAWDSPLRFSYFGVGGRSPTEPDTVIHLSPVGAH